MRFLEYLALWKRLKTILVGSIATLTIWFPFSVHAAEPGREIIGKWKLISILDGTHIASMDEKQARGLLGHIFTIRREGAEFDGYECGHTDFDTERVEPNLFLKENDPYVTAKTLALPNPVTVIDLDCTSVYIKSKNLLVIFWNGFYFDAVRLRK